MGKYTAVDGTEFTDSDIERWADEHERGYTGGHIGPAVPGRPISVGVEAKPFTLRLDANRRAKLDKVAKERNTTISDLMRGLIDSL
ncbi:MAG TPA: ribbon-helix-helix domain-containing protein [Candidatus Dietzia merdigallinarum]|nr:ribbon-helix-helix domain-containing protein [Candidatus Dietzia merdigallinarum]